MMGNRKFNINLFISAVSVLVLAALYFVAFRCLDKDLKSLFDEGFFYLGFRPRQDFTVFTQPLSLGNDLLTAIFPSLGRWDILALRRLAFFSKLSGLLVLCASTLYFFKKEKRNCSVGSALMLVSCILLLGLYIIPSIAININDELVFLEMVVLSLAFLSLGTDKSGIKWVLWCLIGLFSFLAVLCNAPGGIMLYLLSVLFICLYPDRDRPGHSRMIPASIAGLLAGLVIMHFCIISIPDFLSFIKSGISQTSGDYTAAHHSLSRLLVSILLNIRNLILTVVSMLGITFIAEWIKRITKKDWPAILAGLILFAIYYIWQVKPSVGIPNVMTWLLLMTVLVFHDKVSWTKKDIVLVLYLFLMPFALSLGSNSGFLFKSTTVIVPWGILLFILSAKSREDSPAYSAALFLLVSVLVLMGPGLYYLNCMHRESYSFNKEYPIARMDLSKPQSDFFAETYGLLGQYGYQSQKDTILGFCFNEMTIVAMDAVPYTNDQHPEEFLTHDLEGLPRPDFMILSEWDIKKLTPRFEEMGWGFPDDYDIHEMETNPDPGSGYPHTNSTMFCLKERRLPCSSTP